MTEKLLFSLKFELNQTAQYIFVLTHVDQNLHTELKVHHYFILWASRN